ncbi:RICIN domain-containing protein [Actinomadura sediminis]|uniref:RICIN domain-containing protein n=1 Tax=Actinomadura sediminis TaxID=1038904 RepID=A0ABW3EJR6_9ACTN
MRFRLPIALSALLGGAVALVPSGPAAHAEPYPPGEYRIMTDHGGRCLNGPAAADARATVGPCGTVWRLRLMSDGVQIIRAAPDDCLGVSRRDVRPRNLAIRSCEKEPTLWYATHAGDGRYLISLASDGQLLTWHEDEEYAHLVPERPDHGHQLWTFEPAGN